MGAIHISDHEVVSLKPLPGPSELANVTGVIGSLGHARVFTQKTHKELEQ